MTEFKDAQEALDWLLECVDRGTPEQHNSVYILLQDLITIGSPSNKSFRVQYSACYRDGPGEDDCDEDGGTVEDYCCIRCAFLTAFLEALSIVRGLGKTKWFIRLEEIP